MADKIKLRAYAKLNLFLEITGKRDDGYAVAFESFAYKKLGYVDEKGK